MDSRELDWQPSDYSAQWHRRPDGAYLIEPRAQIGPYPPRFTDALEHWVRLSPAQTLLAARGPSQSWVRLSYEEAWERIGRLAAGLSTLELSCERPLLILSGNSIEHFLLGCAALYLGVPYCPVSPAYSQGSSDLSKLREVMRLLTPGLVACFGPGPFARAIGATVPEGVPLLSDGLRVPDRPEITLEELAGRAGRDARAQADAAHRATGPHTIAKLLLTSGSTGHPKAVITTHQMLCSNQSMLRQALPFVVSEPPVLVDWLPWNHTFGGSHNVGLVVFNGGTLYIDEGRPMAHGFAATLANLRDIAPTVYFNVPKGYELLVQHLRTDAALRRRFYSRLRAQFFAGAPLSQDTWDALLALARAAGREAPVLSSWGATETAPTVASTTPASARTGAIGMPAAGNTVKLAPVAAKLELRVRGPNVTPGYWRQPELTAAAFDEEGYYRMGDAVRLLEPPDPTRGLLFDGRLSEDFKLSSGTWVSVGPLRALLLGALAPLAQDLVIAGHGQDFIAVLIFPNVRACALALGADAEGTVPGLCADARLQSLIRQRLAAHASAHAGSSTRIERAVLLAEPASADHGEITDKGSINHSAVLRRRAALVRDLFLTPPPPHVLLVADSRADLGGPAQCALSAERRRACGDPPTT